MPTVRETRQPQTPLGQERQQNPIRNDTTTAATPMTTISINYDFPVTRPVRLTHQQISDSTTMYCVTLQQIEEMENTTCAISHQEYRVGDILCRINVCRHEFLYRELMHWFDINNTCPICRGNVLSTPPVANIPEVPQGVATQTEQTESERVDAITQLLRSFMTPATGQRESQFRLFQDDFDISFVSMVFPSNQDRAV